MIEGISHITLIVQNLDRSTLLLHELFDAKEVYSSEDKYFSISREKFFIIGNQWIVLMEGDTLQNRTYNHIAFKIRDEDFNIYEHRIMKLGLEIKQARPRISGEGRSIYFYDYDNHLFELHTGTLSQRIETYNMFIPSDKIEGREKTNK